ncbi:MAG: NAD-binding protein [Candidatus Aenigmarchaeota archaeon]|nr:NAD-binding protein [Candidatus Aenigmarchaeota archaeon]MCK5321949.1 NAD-binding protein [Candidatus Aenigmarchaeota archaeon]
MRVIIIGGGLVGAHVATMLSKGKHKVTVIEKEEKLAKKLADRLDALVINDDGTDMLVLKNAGIETADAIIALSRDDKTNLMVCQIAKNIGTSKIISRVNIPGNDELFVKLGISLVVPTTQYGVNMVANELKKGGLRILSEIGDAKAVIYELVIEKDSKLIGHDNESLEGSRVCAIYRNGEVLYPGSRNPLQAGDVLIIISKTANMDKIQKLAG